MPPDSGLFIILDCVDSTNNYAMAQIHLGKAKDGNAWFAMEQTDGRGRRGKIWETRKGENIVLSIVADTNFLKTYQQFQLSAAVSLGCYDFCKVYDDKNFKIKWPNDLFWNDRKAGGILIENAISGNIWQWAVIGIGININQTEFTNENYLAVSLKQITREAHDIIESGKELYKCVITRLKELKSKGFDEIFNEYNSVLYKRNEKIKLKKKNIIFETSITGVSHLGQLQTIDSIEHSFDFDEIEWVL